MVKGDERLIFSEGGAVRMKGRGDDGVVVGS